MIQIFITAQEENTSYIVRIDSLAFVWATVSILTTVRYISGENGKRKLEMIIPGVKRLTRTQAVFIGAEHSVLSTDWKNDSPRPARITLPQWSAHIIRFTGGKDFRKGLETISDYTGHRTSLFMIMLILIVTWQYFAFYCIFSVVFFGIFLWHCTPETGTRQTIRSASLVSFLFVSFLFLFYY